MKKTFVILLAMVGLLSAKTLQYNTQFENLENGDSLDYVLHLQMPLDSILAVINGNLGSDNMSSTAGIRQSMVDSLQYTGADWITNYTKKLWSWVSGVPKLRNGRGIYVYINDTTANNDDFRVYSDSTTLLMKVSADSAWIWYLKGDSISLTGTLDAATINTGQGDYELYAMNQNVRTTDDVTFDSAYVGVARVKDLHLDVDYGTLAGNRVKLADSAYGSHIMLSNEGGASDDTLEYVDGNYNQLVVVGCEACATGGTITVKGTGNITLAGGGSGAEFKMTNRYDKLVLLSHYGGTSWAEVSRNNQITGDSLYIPGGANLAYDVTVGDSLYVGGNATVSGILDGDSAHFASGVTIDGGLTITGDFSASSELDSLSFGDEYLDTYSEGWFVCSLGGLTTVESDTAFYTRIGNTVTLSLPGLGGTSNATSMFLYSLPSELITDFYQLTPMALVDNGAYSTDFTPTGVVTHPGSDTLFFAWEGNESGFTNSGDKGMIEGAGFTMRHILNYLIER